MKEIRKEPNERFWRINEICKLIAKTPLSTSQIQYQHPTKAEYLLLKLCVLHLLRHLQGLQSQDQADHS